MSGILDLIDAAVSDWETGPDAVRYNSTLKTGGVVLSNPVVRFGDGPEIPVLSMEVVMRPIVDHFATMRDSFRLMNGRLLGLSIPMGVMAAQLARAFGYQSAHGAPGTPPCACHSAPFPAGRDYRRRTKHRNRRRR